MKTRSPVEVTTRYATTVETLQDAFAFVMGELDGIGATPCITITPVMCWNTDDDDPERFFSVVVSSMLEEKNQAEADHQ